MAIGVKPDNNTLYLWRGRDFKWNFDNLDTSGELQDFPAGELFFEIENDTATPIRWTFDIVGSRATLKVESEEVSRVPDRALWQLVFLATGEAAGGDPIDRGRVVRVGDR